MTSPIDHHAEVLSLSNIKVQYGHRTVLDQIEFSIHAGEFIGLIGANGAGKTTLLHVILGLLKPNEGTIHVNGQLMSHSSKQIGYVPQRIHLDPDTPLRARDLVALGIDGTRFGFPLPSREKRQVVDEILHAVGAYSFADSPVGKLSLGEQQRLLIAQALLTNPRILLLDEPLSSLDIRSTHEVVQLVSHVAKSRGIAVLFVAHDMNPLLGVMDKIIYVANGKTAIGTVDEVIRKDVLSQLYGYEVEVLTILDRILIVGGKEDAIHTEV
ncbi:metal ABC transporter ATP-binding protein [Sulfoacidibacillus ferrooxidans]|nr:ABC transporter ATP-binding protein [Sulfoacidibacillus ferrooxidans]